VELYIVDSEYLRNLTNGNPAIESHFNGYFGRIVLTKLRVRKVPTKMAHDVCSQTLARVLKDLRQGSQVAKPADLGVLVNAVSNRVLAEFLEVSEITSEPLQNPVSIDLTLVTEERKRMVTTALSELTPKEGEILKLMLFEEVDRNQIAENFETEPVYLRVLLHRASSRFHALHTPPERKAPRLPA
jgi:DNA-directed RNA polymerase specialized sigma24 family protein